jgi:predicted permease
MMREIWTRLISYGRRARANRELNEEIAAHLRMATNEYVQQGMSRADAERAARRDFGSVDATKERYRDQFGLPSVDALLQDARIAWRQLGKSPVFTVAACTLLAVGVGASTAVYSVVDAALIAPVPGTDPDRRVWINETIQGREVGGNPARLIDLATRVDAFTAAAGFYGEDAVLTSGGEPRRVPVLRTFGAFFEVVGIQPVLGRAFTEVEARGEGDAIALISNSFWQLEMGGSEAALGQSVQLSGKPFTVVGVMPAATFPRDVDLFIPADLSFQQMDRGGRFLGLAARLRDTTTIDQAQAEVDQLMAALQQQYPDTDEGAGAILQPLQQAVVGDAQAPLIALFAVTLSVLLLTCLNLAGLMLARGLRRRSEVAVRVALGASSSRVVGLFLIEGLMIALAGGLAGLLLAIMGTEVLSTWTTANGLSGPLQVHWQVAGLGMLLAALSGLALGAVPAWQASRRDAAPTLREGRVAMGVGSGRLRRFLVGGQVAVSVVLLIAAALLTRELVHHMGKPLGFQPERVLSVKTQFSWSARTSEIHGFARQALERLAVVPGVVSVGLTDRLPFEGASQSSTILVRGRELPPALAQIGVANRAVSVDYLRTIGVPLLAGEPLRREGAVAAGEIGGDIVVNQALVDRFFGADEAIGSFISFRGGAGGRDAAPRWRRITGIVGDVRRELTEEAVPPEAFGLYDEAGWPLLSFVLATTSPDVTALAASVREAIHEVAPEQVIDSIEPMMTRVDGAAAGQRRNAGIMYGFSGLALVLVIVGLYGLVATEVAQRVPELGVRAALGARGRHIIIEATRHTLITTVIGAVVGVGLAVLAAASLSGVLTAVTPFDPLAIGGALAGMALAAVGAALPSIRRALRIDPATALRQE